MTRLSTAMLLLALTLPGCGDERAVPPLAERRPHPVVRHGKTVTDPYHWLRDRDDPAVIRQLEAENAYADLVMAKAADLVDRIHAELTDRVPETDLSVPVRIDGWEYFSSTGEKLSYRTYQRRRPGSEEAETYFDPNALAKGHRYFGTGAVKVGPHHRLLAWSVDTTGGERYTLRFRDLSAGKDFPESIRDTSYGVVWAEDGRTVFYNTRDDANRPYRVWRHVVGTDPADDVLVAEEKDPKFTIRPGKTRSRAFLTLVSESQTTTEISILEADDPTARFRLLTRRTPGVESYLEHRGDVFYLVTNEDAVNFRLMVAPVADPTKWREKIPHREDVTLGRIAAFRRHLVISERKNGYRTLRFVDADSFVSREIRGPSAAGTLWLSSNPELDTTIVRFIATSMETPRTVIDLDMETGKQTVRKVQPVRDYDAAKYGSERLFATSPDGERVPITLVYRKDLRRSGGKPLVLGVYAAYGASSDPSFRVSRLPLLDRGIIYAIAHARGGSERGRRWYEQGRVLEKMNTFTDTIACAEHLVAKGYTSPDRMAIRGQSAGGLVVGAVLNLRPDLFRAAVALVPFVDVVNTMMDPTIPLTVVEYEEWGDPRITAQFDAMLAWSPYDNVSANRYPHLFVTSGLNDPRVAFWGPAKWVAKLRHRKTGDEVILLRTHLGAGHGGSSGRFDRRRELAIELAFLVRYLAAGE